jgi:hypothetical protein
MNREEVINKIVESGIDAKTAEKKVKQIEDKIKVQLAKQDAGVIETAINLAYNQLVSTVSKEKVRGVVIGVGEEKDANGYAKHVATVAYEENPQRAIAEGLVTVETDEDGEDVVIPLDTKEFFDADKKKKNGNFGKPLPTRMQREIVLAIENDVVRAFANVDVRLGDEYDVYGTVKKPYMNVSKNPKPRFVRTPNGTERWLFVHDSVGNSDFAQSYSDMMEAKNNTFGITKAFVRAMGTTEYGTWVTLESDENGQSIICNIGNEVATFVNEEIDVGYEVIVVGSLSRYTPNGSDEEKVSLRVTGMIPNPSSVAIKDAIGDVSDILYAED